MINVKILIVDDEVDYCMIMQNYFEDKGYSVTLAFTLHEGMRLMDEVKPDILCLDNNLPDGEGWLKLPEIVEAFPNMKIHLISAYGNRPEQWENNPNIRFWEKPISTDDLEKSL